MKRVSLIAFLGVLFFSVVTNFHPAPVSAAEPDAIYRASFTRGGWYSDKGPSRIGAAKWTILASPTYPPIAGGGRLYIVCNKELSAYQLSSGALLWKYNNKDITSCPSVVGGVLYVGCKDGLVALESADGTEKWLFATDSPVITSPVISGDICMFATQKVEFYGVRDKLELWRNTDKLVEGAGHFALSFPACKDDLVIFPVRLRKVFPPPSHVQYKDSVKLRALSVASGVTRWTEASGQGYPIIVPGAVYGQGEDAMPLVLATGDVIPEMRPGAGEVKAVLAGQGKIYKFTSTGLFRSDIDALEKNDFIPLPRAVTPGLVAGTDDFLYYARSNAFGAVDLRRDCLAWEHNTVNRPIIHPPLPLNGMLIICGSEGTVTAYAENSGQYKEPEFVANDRGNTARTGEFDGFVGDKVPVEIWRDVDGPYFSQAGVVAGDRYCYWGRSGTLRCLDIATGKLLWDDKASSPAGSTPIVFDDLLIYNSPSELSARRLANGGKVWAIPSGSRVPPIILNNLLFSSASHLYAIEPSSGAIVWTVPGLGQSLPPTLLEWMGKLMLVYQDDGFRCVEPATGFGNLRIPNDRVRAANAATDGKTIYGSASGKLTAFDPNTLTTRWQYQTGKYDGNNKPCVGRGKVFYTSNDHCCYAFDPATGEVLWKYVSNELIYSSPSLCGDKLLFGNNAGVLTCLNADTGSLYWEKQLDVPLTGNPVISGDTIIIGGADGTFALRSKK